MFMPLYLIMKIRKRTIYITIFLLGILLFVIFSSSEKEYGIKGDRFFYAKNRDTSSFSMQFNSSDGILDIYKIHFLSRKFIEYKTEIYGLLFIPRNIKNSTNDEDKIPGVVLLPGGGGTKEVESRLASIIAKEGYAVLTIDQRGVGETRGYFLSIEDDYGFFTKGKEPVQHLSVYDALRSFDVLGAVEGVDKDKIALVGESMGGRYAMIASALDNNINGVIVISSSGFHISKDSSTPYNLYLRSIDPDNYVDLISPRYFIMIHGTNDTVVQVRDAQITFNKAKEPKSFYLIEGCQHGYCDNMLKILSDSLKKILKK